MDFEQFTRTFPELHRTEAPYTRRSMKTQDGSLHVLSTSGNGHTLYRKISHVQGKVWPSFPPQSDDWLVTKKVAYLSAFNYNSASKISNLSYLQHFQTTLTTSSSGYVSKWLEPKLHLPIQKQIWTKHWTIPLSPILSFGGGEGEGFLEANAFPKIFMLPSKELGASFAPPRIPRCASSPSQGHSGPSPLGGHSRLMKHSC